MAPFYRIYHPGKRRFSPLKNTVKFLSFCQDQQIHKDILSRSPPNVIKGICNAAINCQRGEVSTIQGTETNTPSPSEYHSESCK